MSTNMARHQATYCSNCGELLNADAKFCSACGHATTNAPAPAEPHAENPASRLAPQTAVVGATLAAQPLYMTKPGESSGSTRADADRRNEANLGLALLLVGALVMVIAVFLPQAEANTFARIEHNTILQNDTTSGLLVVLGAILAAALGYRAWARDSSKAALGVLIGIAAAGFALYLGLDKSALTLCSALDGSNCVSASPGIGVYALGIGGLLVAAGSFGVGRSGFSRDA